MLLIRQYSSGVLHRFSVAMVWWLRCQLYYHESVRWLEHNLTVTDREKARKRDWFA